MSLLNVLYYWSGLAPQMAGEFLSWQYPACMWLSPSQSVCLQKEHHSFLKDLHILLLTKWSKKYISKKIVKMFRIYLVTNLTFRCTNLPILVVKIFQLTLISPADKRFPVKIRIMSHCSMPAAQPLWTVFLGVPKDFLERNLNECGIL